MLTIGAVTVLLTFLYWRPQEIFDELPQQSLNAVVLLTGLTLLLDARVGAIRLRSSPQLALMLAFMGWCFLTITVKAPDSLAKQLTFLGISVITFAALCAGLQTLRALTAVVAIFAWFSVAMAGLGVTQGLTPPICYQMAVAMRGGALKDIPDGRPCAVVEDCPPEDGSKADYLCERPGPLGTHSVVRRVRYRGMLEDPNEMAWALNMGMPLSIALYEQRRSLFRRLVAAAMIILGGICVVMTASRSGQLGILAALGVYFFRRFRWGGVVAMAVLSVPLLLFGGRSGGEADASTDLRLEAWSAAFTMLRENPFLGVGAGQFMEHHVRTAHNSFLLTLAELGPVGFFLWTANLYLAFKTTLRAQSHLAAHPNGTVARSTATALLASLVGTVVSLFFLSLAYHPILWLCLGLVAALAAAVQRHDPDFRVSLDWRDLAGLAVGDIVLVVGTAVYVRVKGF